MNYGQCCLEEVRNALFRISAVYEIRNTVSGKRYVGSSQDVKGRWNKHRTLLARGAHHSKYLQASWDKHGSSAFAWVILERVELKNNLVPREQAWMNLLSPQYNMSPTAGSVLGSKRSKEYCDARSRLLKGKPVHPNAHEALRIRNLTKRPMPEETKRKISAAKTGKKRSPLSQEQKDRIRAFFTGYKRGPQSPDVIAARVAKLRGMKLGPQSPEHVAKRVSARQATLQRKREGKSESSGILSASPESSGS